MEDNTMNKRIVCASLLASLAIITGAQVARAQVTTDWPVANGTPQQTRFAGISYGAPPVGILWRDPYSPDPLNSQFPVDPVLSDGLLVFAFGTTSGYSTRIYDAATGQVLYTFPEADLAVHAIWKNTTQTILFRALAVFDNTHSTTIVTVNAYDLSPIILRTPGGTPIWQWTSQFTLSYAMRPCLNCMDGALYLQNHGGIIKINGTDGTTAWTSKAPSDGSAAVGDVAGRRLVITAGGPAAAITVQALDDFTGTTVWQTLADYGAYVTLVNAPDGSARVVVPFRIPWSTTGKKTLTGAGLLCLDAATGAEVWRRPLKANCYPANGPVAVRYVYNTAGQLTGANIFITPGSDTPADTVHPLFAFDLNGANAWPASLPNPLQLPAPAAYTEPAVTQDRVFLVLYDGSLFSVDLNSGTTSANPFQLDRWATLPILAGTASGPLVYAYSHALGYMAIAPTPTHNMSITSFGVPDQVQAGQTITLSVTVKNTGNFPETVDVTLNVGGTLQTWPSQSFAVQASRTYTWNWTPTVTPTKVQVSASLSPVSGDTGPYDNALSKWVTVLPTDVVGITTTYWVKLNAKLYVEATSSSAGQAILKVYYPDKATDTTPGTMQYNSQRGVYVYNATEPVYYNTVYVESSLGGSATAGVGVRPR
jgi:hypothetical protein